MPDALPAVEPTASKHCCQSILLGAIKKLITCIILKMTLLLQTANIKPSLIHADPCWACPKYSTVLSLRINVN